MITAMKREEGQKRRDIVLLQWTTSITHMPEEEDEGEERERTKKGRKNSRNPGEGKYGMSCLHFLWIVGTLSPISRRIDRSVRRVTWNHLALSTALLTNLSHPFPDIYPRFSFLHSFLPPPHFGALCPKSGPFSRAGINFLKVFVATLVRNAVSISGRFFFSLLRLDVRRREMKESKCGIRRGFKSRNASDSSFWPLLCQVGG